MAVVANFLTILQSIESISFDLFLENCTEINECPEIADESWQDWYEVHGQFFQENSKEVNWSNKPSGDKQVAKFLKNTRET